MRHAKLRPPSTINWPDRRKWTSTSTPYAAHKTRALVWGCKTAAEATAKIQAEQPTVSRRCYIEQANFLELGALANEEAWEGGRNHYQARFAQILHAQKPGAPKAERDREAMIAARAACIGAEQARRWQALQAFGFEIGANPTLEQCTLYHDTEQRNSALFEAEWRQFRLEMFGYDRLVFDKEPTP